MCKVVPIQKQSWRSLLAVTSYVVENRPAFGSISAFDIGFCMSAPLFSSFPNVPSPSESVLDLVGQGGNDWRVFSRI